MDRLARWMRAAILAIPIAFGAGMAGGYFEDTLGQQAARQEMVVSQQQVTSDYERGFKDAYLMTQGPWAARSDADPDCPPAVRQELERLGVLNDLQSIGDELSNIDKKLGKKQQANRGDLEQIRGDATDLLKLIAACNESG